MNKILVAYFSASGVTKSAAEKLAQAAGGELFEIKPEIAYTDEDLNWNNKNSRSTVEMNDPTSRPAIAQKLPNMADYGTIFIGFPVWWYREPSIIDTFMESYDFSGKTLIPFCTSGGSGISGAEKSMKELCPPSVNWKSGKRISGRPSENEIASLLTEVK